MEQLKESLCRAPTSRSDEIINGLLRAEKRIPCKLLYDERGSELFDKICSLEEYYLTRTECAIMETAINEIAELAGPDTLLIEYGSGSSAKTRLMLDRLPSPVGYIPIDISREFLWKSADSLRVQYPELPIFPLCADFTTLAELPEPPLQYRMRLAYFPGSTIGNFNPAQARELLQRIKAVCGRKGALVIGVDMKKDPRLLWRAYNDSKGVTAEFNKNVLRRMNQELGADFNPAGFKHHAPYRQEKGCVEMHLVSTERQSVHFDGVTINFGPGESIHTESSYKYSLDDFRVLAEEAGFISRKSWTDPQQLFSIHFLSVEAK